MRPFARVADELVAVPYSFGFWPWNSNVKKLAMYIALGLFAYAAIRAIRGELDLTNPGVLVLWTFLAGTFTFLLGKNQEGEVRHRRKKRGDPED